MALKPSLFEDHVPMEERTDMLQQNCEKVIPQFSYLKQLTPDEMDQRREEKVQKDIEVSDLQDELKEVKDDFKRRIEGPAVRSKELLTIIKNGHEDCQEPGYVFRDDDSGMIGVYDSRGILITSRRMKPEEKQGNMFSDVSVLGTSTF